MEFSFNTVLLILFLLWPLISKIFGKGKQNKKGTPTSYDEIPVTEQELEIDSPKKIKDRVFSWDELLSDVQTATGIDTPIKETKPIAREASLYIDQTINPTFGSPIRTDEFRRPGSRAKKESLSSPISAVAEKKESTPDFNLDFENPNNLRNAIIYKEIFDKPVALRRR